ncbi:MAG: rod-binding protein, partial [Azonexus sp.]|nr:rod-binding protein [Azonexus sp.]
MAIKIQDTPNRAAFDPQSAQDLRGQFAKNPQEGLQAASRQFEQMFVQMVMKSMRDTVPQDGLLDSDASRLYTSLLDQQMAQSVAASGKLGFAKLIEQQLGKNLPSGEQLAKPGEAAAKAAAQGLPLAASDERHLRYAPVLSALPTSADYAAAAKTAAPGGDNGDVPATARDFTNRVWPHAVEASRSTGIPPQFLI